MSDHLSPEAITARRDGEEQIGRAEQHLRECPSCRGKLREAGELAGILRRFAVEERQQVPETPARLVARAVEIMLRPQPSRFLGTVIGRILGERWLKLEFDSALTGAMVWANFHSLSVDLAARALRPSAAPLMINAGMHQLVLRGRPAPGGAVIEIWAMGRRMAPAAGLRFSLRSPGRATVAVETDVEGYAEVAVLAGESTLIVHADVPREIALRME